MKDGGGSGLRLGERLREGAAEHGVEALSVMGFVVVWQLLAVAIANPLKLPSFLQVVDALLRQWETILWVDLRVSLVHFAIGMAAGLLVALPIGMAMGWSRVAEDLRPHRGADQAHPSPRLDPLRHHLVRLDAPRGGVHSLRGGGLSDPDQLLRRLPVRPSGLR